MNNLKYLDFILENIKDADHISYKTLQEKINVNFINNSPCLLNLHKWRPKM